MNSKYFDTHIHLDLVKDFEKTLRYIEKEKMYVISMTNLPALFGKNMELIKSNKIRLALGFHPELVYQYKNQIPLMWKLLDKTRYIGEVGLDLKNRTIEEKNCQINFFSELIEKCNYRNGKIISIHSRGSESEIVSILNENRKNKIILHWYSGNLKDLYSAINLNCYFSINYSMVTTQKGQNIIKKIPLNKLLTETDSPFTKNGNRISNVEDLPSIVSEIARLKEMDEKTMKNQLFLNFTSLIE